MTSSLVSTATEPQRDIAPPSGSPRFCTRCGRPTEHGRCASCEQHRRRAPGPLLGVLAIAVVLLVLIALLGTTADLRHQVAELRRTVEDQGQALDSAVEEQRSMAGAIADRVSALESAAAETGQDTATLAAAIAPSVFTVSAGDATGSAWVVTSSGSTSRLITNYHVVSDVWRRGDRAVQLHEGQRVWDAEVVDVSEGSDLAVIEVDASFPALEQAAGLPAVGDPVIAAGAPLGLDDSVSTGIVSAIRTEGVDDYIQFSAPVSPGSSGGPLVDANGGVLGVTVMKAVVEGAEGLGFAIPVSLVCDVVDC